MLNLKYDTQALLSIFYRNIHNSNKELDAIELQANWHIFFS